MKLFYGIALLLAISSFAMATPTGCLSLAGTDVTTLSMGCTIGNLLFDEFSVTSAPPGTTIFLSSTGTSIVTGGVNLGFQITTPTPPVDTLFDYRVTALNNTIINSVNTAHNGTGNTRIQELVCSVPLQGGICPNGDVLANFANPPDSNASFSPQGQIYVMQDISLSSSHDFISSYVSGNGTLQGGAEGTVPEPASAMLIGGGLIGIAALTRRLRKS
jgi:hypothetical protein